MLNSNCKRRVKMKTLIKCRFQNWLPIFNNNVHATTHVLISQLLHNTTFFLKFQNLWFLTPIQSNYRRKLSTGQTRTKTDQWVFAILYWKTHILIINHVKWSHSWFDQIINLKSKQINFELMENWEPISNQASGLN